MSPINAIKKAETRQTARIAADLIDKPGSKFNWRIIIFPLYIYDFIRYRRRLQVLRKNLFFTRQLALEAANNIHQEKDRTWEIRRIEIKTGEILDKEKKGIYTDKIRNRQLREVEFLIDHFLDLLASNLSGYNEMLKAKYSSKGSYQNFLSSLTRLEEDVIQAAISTMRKGTKKERREWFDRVREATRKVRREAINRIYGE